MACTFVCYTFSAHVQDQAPGRSGRSWLSPAGRHSEVILSNERSNCSMDQKHSPDSPLSTSCTRNPLLATSVSHSDVSGFIHKLHFHDQRRSVNNTDTVMGMGPLYMTRFDAFIHKGNSDRSFQEFLPGANQSTLPDALLTFHLVQST